MHPTADPDASIAIVNRHPRPPRPGPRDVAVDPCWPGAVAETPDAPLIGREADLAAIRRLVIGRDRTFVTLAGIGGVGKSRLAVEVTRRAMVRRDGRVAFVPLDGVSDASLVVPAIAGAMGVPDEPGRTLVESLAEALGRAPSLLVLDTVEHVRSAAPALADLLARTPGLTILATSRIAIGVPRERVVWVDPLPVPPDTEADPDELMRNPAVALFLARAAVSRPEIEATPTNAALAAKICRRLDGIPLAIELAAAALRVLAPHQLVDQLEGRIGETGVEPSVDAGRDEGGSGPARQRSLRAAMDWSIGLLPEPVLRLYRRVSVISGTFGSPTATAMLDGGERRGLAPLGHRGRVRPPAAGRRLAPAARGRGPRVHDADDGARGRAGPARAQRRGHRDALGPRLPGARRGRGGRARAAHRRRPRGPRPAGGGARRHPRVAGMGDVAGRRDVRAPARGDAGRVLADARPPHGGAAPPRGRAVAGRRPAAGRPSQGPQRRGPARLVPGRLPAGRGVPPRGALDRPGDGRRGGDGVVPQLAGHQRLRERRPRRGRGVRVRGARDPPPDRRAGRDRAGAQRPGRRPPLPRRPRPRPRDVRREPVAQGGPRATRTGSRSR